jgi:2-dehydropantoate 2-reductase
MTPEGRMDITRKLGDFKTSMLRDTEAGRGIEIEPILGALVEIADRLAEPVPNLRSVLGLVRVREACRVLPS